MYHKAQGVAFHEVYHAFGARQCFERTAYGYGHDRQLQFVGQQERTFFETSRSTGVCARTFGKNNE